MKFFVAFASLAGLFASLALLNAFNSAKRLDTKFNNMKMFGNRIA